MQSPVAAVSHGKSLQTALDVFQPGRIAPVRLRREIQHPFVRCPIQPELADVETPAFAHLLILQVHIGVEVFELPGEAASHRSHSIDRIDQDLRRTVKYIAYDIGYHRYCLPLIQFQSSTGQAARA